MDAGLIYERLMPQHRTQNSIHMKQITINYALFYSYENMLTRFKRAKSEDTLDTMYRGAIYKANGNLQGNDLFQAQIAIERALNQCQQDFDTSLLGMTRKANHALKQTDDPYQQYNPEDEMRRLLADLG
jgi:hypothetical protein